MTLRGKTLRPGMNILSMHKSVDGNVVSGNEIFDVPFCKLKPILYNDMQHTKFDYFNNFPAFSVRFYI